MSASDGEMLPSEGEVRVSDGEVVAQRGETAAAATVGALSLLATATSALPCREESGCGRCASSLSDAGACLHAYWSTSSMTPLMSAGESESHQFMNQDSETSPCDLRYASGCLSSSMLRL